MESSFKLLSDSVVPNLPGLTDGYFNGDKVNAAHKAFTYICSKHIANGNSGECSYRFSIQSTDSQIIHQCEMERKSHFMKNEEPQDKFDGNLRCVMDTSSPDEYMSVFVHIKKECQPPPNPEPGNWSYIIGDVWVVSATITELIRVAELDYVARVTLN